MEIGVINLDLIVERSLRDFLIFQLNLHEINFRARDNDTIQSIFIDGRTLLKSEYEGNRCERILTCKHLCN